MARLQVADEGRVWMTVECRAALEAIQPPVVRKKRDTVVLLACQMAGIVAGPKTGIFRDPRAVSESKWYMEWQYIPEVRAALEICTVAAQSWMDATTALNAQIAVQQVQAKIAQSAEVPVTALQAIELDTKVRADHRLAAIHAHLALLDPELAARMGPSGAGVQVEITDQPEQVVKLDLSEFPVDVLRAIADEGTAGANTAGCTGGIGAEESS